MTKLRRFRADFIKTPEGTGIGITEHRKHWNEQTVAIRSIYEPRNISNRDATMNILQMIYNNLADDEGAVLQMSKYSQRKNLARPFRKRLSAQRITGNRGQLYQAQLLAEDAIRRKSDICERFAEPMRFSVVEQEREERTNKNCEEKERRT